MIHWLITSGSNETHLPGLAEEEEGKLKENNLLNEQPPPALHHLASQLSTRWPDAHVLKLPDGHCKPNKITYNRITYQQMQKI